MESSIASQSIDDLLAVKVESISLLSSPPPSDTTDTSAQSAALITHTSPLPVEEEEEEEEVEKVAIAVVEEVEVVVGDEQVSTPSIPPQNITSNSGSIMEVVDKEKDENENDSSVVVTEDVCMEDPPHQSNPVQIGQVNPVSLHTNIIYIHILTYRLLINIHDLLRMKVQLFLRRRNQSSLWKIRTILPLPYPCMTPELYVLGDIFLHTSIVYSFIHTYIHDSVLHTYSTYIRTYIHTVQT